MIRTAHAAGALVDLDQRAILWASEAEDALGEQWLTDQLAPRLLSHLGQFVLHGGGVEVAAGRAILIVGPRVMGSRP